MNHCPKRYKLMYLLYPFVWLITVGAMILSSFLMANSLIEDMILNMHVNKVAREDNKRNSV